MKYFWRFFLALVISAIVVVTYGSIQAVGNENSQVEKVTNMASRKSKRSNKFQENSLQMKENNLQLKVELPEIVALSIPENKPGVTAEFSFTVSLTNNRPLAKKIYVIIRGFNFNRLELTHNCKLLTTNYNANHSGGDDSDNDSTIF